MLKRTILTSLTALLALVPLSGIAEKNRTSATLKGTYLEARTASVFAGPCHYNGELTTTGREAQMVWNFAEGKWNGVDLSGLTVMAAVVCDKNLKEDSPRRSVLYVDAKASIAQFDTIKSLMLERYGSVFGEVLAVKRVPISFSIKSKTYRVQVENITNLAIEAMPDNACCKQPSFVCYTPLAEISERRVGFTLSSGIAEKTLKTQWAKSNQNSAFYGGFTLK